MPGDEPSAERGPEPPAGPDGPREDDLEAVPPPDLDAEPAGYLVEAGPAVRLHFLDWGGPSAPPGSAPSGVLLVHGIAGTAWVWSPVARRLRSRVRVVALDLRGHGLSDQPTLGYEPETLVGDVLAVAEGAGLLGPPRGGEERRLVLAGHGFGAIVAAWTAASLGPSCAGLVLVDGGWEDIGATSELTPAEFVRTLEEPPEVLRSLDAFLADRRSFDPATWDADQERASRASVIELPAGRVVPVTPPHALGGIVEAMFAYRPSAVLPAVAAPIVALVAGEVDEPARDAALEAIQATLVEAGRRPIDVRRFRPVGHNLMRYRPVAVAAAILGLVEGR